jgi:hypothetical protein
MRTDPFGRIMFAEVFAREYLQHCSPGIPASLEKRMALCSPGAPTTAPTTSLDDVPPSIRQFQQRRRPP